MTMTVGNTRIALAGALALSALTVPALSVLGGPVGSSVPLASCPVGDVIDAATGGCVAATEVTATTPNPINPEGADLQTGSITSSDPAKLGQLPEINGIPCNGDNTGLCIGLSEVDSLQPHSTVSGVN